MERQRREEEVKTKSSKKAQDAEQSMMNKVWLLHLCFHESAYQHNCMQIDHHIFVLVWLFTLVIFHTRVQAHKLDLSKLVVA
jgi:hypothetical protein